MSLFRKPPQRAANACRPFRNARQKCLPWQAACSRQRNAALTQPQLAGGRQTEREPAPQRAHVVEMPPCRGRRRASFAAYVASAFCRSSCSRVLREGRPQAQRGEEEREVPFIHACLPSRRDLLPPSRREEADREKCRSQSRQFALSARARYGYTAASQRMFHTAIRHQAESAASLFYDAAHAVSRPPRLLACRRTLMLPGETACRSRHAAGQRPSQIPVLLSDVAAPRSKPSQRASHHASTKRRSMPPFAACDERMSHRRRR